MGGGREQPQWNLRYRDPVSTRMGSAFEEVQSPQRYELGHMELRAVAPQSHLLDFVQNPQVYTRRIRRTADVRADAVRLPPHSSKPASVREDGIVVIVLRGEMETCIEGQARQTCSTFSVTYHPPGEAGTGTVGPRATTMLVLSIGVDASRDLVDAGLASRDWKELDAIDHAARVLQEFSCAGPGADLALEELTQALFASSSGALRAEPRRLRWWSKLQDVLNDLGDQHVSLNALAREVGLHPVHLSASFKHHTGKTIGQTVRERRLRAACRLILNTSAPLGVIAAETGFADQSHFIRAFRQTFGMAPSLLRPLASQCEFNP